VLIFEYKQATPRPSSPIVNDGLTVWITGHRRRKQPVPPLVKRRPKIAEALVFPAPDGACKAMSGSGRDHLAQSDSACAETARHSAKQKRLPRWQALHAFEAFK
jgi:hypothetical protein